MRYKFLEIILILFQLPILFRRASHQNMKISFCKIVLLIFSLVTLHLYHQQRKDFLTAHCDALWNDSSGRMDTYNTCSYQYTCNTRNTKDRTPTHRHIFTVKGSHISVTQRHKKTLPLPHATLPSPTHSYTPCCIQGRGRKTSYSSITQLEHQRRVRGERERGRKNKCNKVSGEKFAQLRVTGIRLFRT